MVVGCGGGGGGGGGVREFLLPYVDAMCGCRAWSEDPHFFYIFSCVHRSVGSSSSGWTTAAPTVLLGCRFCPADTRRENNVIMTLSPRRVPVGLASEDGRSPGCKEFVGVTASSVWGRCWWAPLVEGAAGGGAGRQGSPGLPVEWLTSQ